MRTLSRVRVIVFNGCRVLQIQPIYLICERKKIGLFGTKLGWDGPSRPLYSSGTFINGCYNFVYLLELQDQQSNGSGVIYDEYEMMMCSSHGHNENLYYNFTQVRFFFELHVIIKILSVISFSIDMSVEKSHHKDCTQKKCYQYGSRSARRSSCSRWGCARSR